MRPTFPDMSRKILSVPAGAGACMQKRAKCGFTCTCACERVSGSDEGGMWCKISCCYPWCIVLVPAPMPMMMHHTVTVLNGRASDAQIAERVRTALVTQMYAAPDVNI